VVEAYARLSEDAKLQALAAGEDLTAYLDGRQIIDLLDDFPHALTPDDRKPGRVDQREVKFGAFEVPPPGERSCLRRQWISELDHQSRRREVLAYEAL
jgi:hypothetical protein